MIVGKTHELILYAGRKHECGVPGTVVLHLWFRGESIMRFDLEIALERDDISHVDVVDCVNHTTIRKYHGDMP